MKSTMAMVALKSIRPHDAILLPRLKSAVPSPGARLVNPAPAV